MVRNLVWGVAWGLAFATGFSTFAVVLATLRGSTEYPTYNMNLLEIIASYYAAGLIAGIAVGMLRPIARSRDGAVVVGMIAGTLVYGAVGFALGERGRDWILTSLMIGIPAGGISGYLYSKPEKQ